MPRSQHIRGCYSFSRDLAKEMKRTFPNFQNNIYYKQRIGEEEKKLISMQMKSHLLFYIYYRMLWAYRDLRKKINR
jgi:glycosyltransferase EpsH